MFYVHFGSRQWCLWLPKDNTYHCWEELLVSCQSYSVARLCFRINSGDSRVDQYYGRLLLFVVTSWANNKLILIIHGNFLRFSLGASWRGVWCGMRIWNRLWIWLLNSPHLTSLHQTICWKRLTLNTKYYGYEYTEMAMNLDREVHASTYKCNISRWHSNEHTWMLWMWQTKRLWRTDSVRLPPDPVQRCGSHLPRVIMNLRSSSSTLVAEIKSIV